MKISLSKFGFCGIVAQDLQSWKDTTIIGWFTTMTMIRNILIITVIAALVPTAMSNVSASAGSEIALFSGVSDSDGLSISGNGDTAKMELKATNGNGKTNKVSDFQMNADNVLYIKVGDKVTVNDNVDFTKAITTDGNNNQKAIGITSDGVIDFTGYTQGVSTLDVVVDDDRAYEAIIVIGQQPPEVTNKQVTKVNNNLETRVVYPDPCDEDEERIDGKCEPKCDEGQERIDGMCEDPMICEWYYECPYPYEPEPVECEEGFVDSGNGCEPERIDCIPEDIDCKNQNILPTPEPEPIVFPDNSVEFPTEEIDCKLQPELCEEIPNVPLEETEEEELPEEEELTETTEIEEIEEEEEEVEEESGESEEVENEESEEESGGESEEESGGGN